MTGGLRQKVEVEEEVPAGIPWPCLMGLNWRVGSKIRGYDSPSCDIMSISGIL
jgi:hypothetical protein